MAAFGEPNAGFEGRWRMATSYKKKVLLDTHAIPEVETTAYWRLGDINGISC